MRGKLLLGEQGLDAGVLGHGTRGPGLVYSLAQRISSAGQQAGASSVSYGHRDCDTTGHTRLPVRRRLYLSKKKGIDGLLCS